MLTHRLDTLTLAATEELPPSIKDNQLKGWRDSRRPPDQLRLWTSHRGWGTQGGGRRGHQVRPSHTATGAFLNRVIRLRSPN